MDLLNNDFDAVCAIKEVRHLGSIKKNYSVRMQNGLIISLVEKPEIVENNYMGCGTYFFKPGIFDYIKNRFSKILFIHIITWRKYWFKFSGVWINSESPCPTFKKSTFRYCFPVKAKTSFQQKIFRISRSAAINKIIFLDIHLS